MNNGSISPLAGKFFVVIGAGGAGKALAYGAKEKGAKVIIANRTYGSFFFINVAENSIHAKRIYASIPFHDLMARIIGYFH